MRPGGRARASRGEAGHGVPSAGAAGSGPTASAAWLLEVRGLRKRFGGSVVLAGVDLRLGRGGVLALLGENGAGKSTLIEILAGVRDADEGAVTVAGRPLGTEAAAQAMAFVHQDLGLVEWMSVAENIALGAGYPRRAGLICRHRLRDRAADALRRVGADLDPDARIAGLTRAERAMVAVARAVAAGTEIIVLDEPTAFLSAEEATRLFGVLRALRDRGCGILYVTHRLDELRQVADTVVVLRDGRVIVHGPVDHVGPGRLARAVTGRGPAGRPATSRRPGAVVLSVTDLVTGPAGPVGFDLRAGEMVALAGPAGAGPPDVGRALAGARPIQRGRVLLRGRPYRPRSVPDASAAGVGFVTSDRHEQLAPDLSVRENLLANPRARGVPALRWIGPHRERADAARLMSRLGVRGTGTEAVVTTLSGGNRQKVALGRCLGAACDLLILEEPTAGVDVGAKAGIHRLLGDAVAAGLAVLLVCSDYEEIVRMCDRALVFAHGMVIAELTGADLTVAGLVRAVSTAAGAPESGR